MDLPGNSQFAEDRNIPQSGDNKAGYLFLYLTIEN